MKDDDINHDIDEKDITNKAADIGFEMNESHSTNIIIGVVPNQYMNSISNQINFGGNIKSKQNLNEFEEMEMHRKSLNGF